MFNRIRGHSSILKIVEERNFGWRLLIFLTACYGVALNYNMFFAPNNLVVGGMSGLAIVVKKLTGIPIPIFLFSSMAILIIIAFVFLGKKKAFNTVIGATVFTLMVPLSAPLAEQLNITIKSDFLMLLVTSLIYGGCSGLVYRAGYNTGGADVISAIINQYLKIPMGRANAFVNLTIVIIGSIVFGPTKTMYALFILIIANRLIDVVLLGINDSKMCFVKAKHSDKIEDYLMNHLHLGVTEVSSSGGIFSEKKTTLLVIVPFDAYYGFKHLVLKMDPEAFILTHDCYAVVGGFKKHIIPF
jgi:uncharacterized membrane-anchored protein YitT (DUF2179 family)